MPMQRMQWWMRPAEPGLGDGEPIPSSPIRLVAGTRTSSKVSSQCPSRSV